MAQLFAAFGVNWSLLIAQAVNFGIVLIALWYFVYRPVSRVLEQRREKIAQGVADAEAAAKKLAGADSEAAGRVTKAEHEAESIVGLAREAANTERARIMSAAEARAAQVAKDAEARAAEERARARRESEKEIARLAMLAAEKVMSGRHAS